MNEEIKVYFNSMSDDKKDELFKKAKSALAKRIEKDDNFINDYFNIIKIFSSKDTMIEQLIKDAENAKIDIEDIELFTEEWLSWILRI